MTPLKFIQNGLISYSQRIADLRGVGIGISTKKVPFENQFGHKSEHGAWSLTDKDKAKKFYKELSK